MIELKSPLARIVAQILITIGIIPFALPIIWMVAGSFGGDGWKNYTTVLAVPELPLFFLNSSLIAVGTIVIAVAATMLGAFAFAKLQTRGKEVFFAVILSALTLPTAVITIPLFITIQHLGLFNTYWAVIIPLAALQIPFNLLLARGFMASIPDEILEAARMDGCSVFGAFLRVILPLTRPILAVVIVWTLVASWNEYLLPLIFLQRTDQQTVTLLPQFFQGQFGADLGKVLAASVVALLPEVAGFLAVQRWFERGLSAGAIK